MPKRFTDTEKWLKGWHRELPPEKKLFFDYLCDRCDIAGCLDIDPVRVAFDLGLPLAEMDGIWRDIKDVCYEDGVAYILDFIEFQYPRGLRPDLNKAHLGVKRVLEKRMEKLPTLTNRYKHLLLDGACKPLDSLNAVGLDSPTGIGVGIGIGIGVGTGTGDTLAGSNLHDWTITFGRWWAMLKHVHANPGYLGVIDPFFTTERRFEFAKFKIETDDVGRYHGLLKPWQLRDMLWDDLRDYRAHKETQAKAYRAWQGKAGALVEDVAAAIGERTGKATADRTKR